MARFTYNLKYIFQYNKDGSGLTQNKRYNTLDLIGRQLHEGGYKIKDPHNLKPKHISYLISRWKNEGLETSTIKDRLSQIRWLLIKVNKESIIPKDNVSLGIGRRVYVDNKDKAIRLNDSGVLEKINKIENNNLKLQIELAANFGLRFEEASKFKPHEADKGDYILVHYGTKGGQDRSVPIQTEQQRDFLNKCKLAIDKHSSMIPKEYTYIKWQKMAYNEFKAIGLSKTSSERSFHALRHGYAQDFYMKRTGWDSCPVHFANPEEWEQHIKTKYELSDENFKEKDTEGRIATAEVLGHHREDIVAQYIGGK